MRSLIKTAHIVLAAAIFFSSLTAVHAMLAGPQFRGLVPYRDGVLALHYAYDARTGERKSVYLVFDGEGHFQKELKFMIGNKPLTSPVLAVTEDGHFWFLHYTENKDYEVVSTEFYVFDQNQKLLQQRSVLGEWEAVVDAAGTLYVADPTQKALTIEMLDLSNGKRKPHAALDLPRNWRVVDLDSESSIRWKIGSTGNIYVLIGASESGLVKAYEPDGTLLWQQKVTPDPVSSVAYLKDLYVDSQGNVFVLHSSWEVSSATENQGSIIKLDARGQFQFRIKEGIDYLQEIAVNKKEEIYSYSLGDTLVKHSDQGKLLLEWNACAPQFGESWEEKVQREREAAGVTEKSTSEELVLAAAYGDWKTQNNAQEWLIQRGPVSVRAVLSGLQKYPAYQLNHVLGSLTEKNPEEVIPQLRDAFKTESDDLKKAVSTLLAFYDKNPPEELRPFLEQLEQSANAVDRETAESALRNLGRSEQSLQEMFNSLRQTNLTEEKREQLEKNIIEDLPAAFELLTPVLMNPKDSKRNQARDLFLDAVSNHIRYDQFSNDKTPIKAPETIVQRLKEWSEGTSIYLSNVASVALSAFGEKGYMKQALEAAKQNEIYIPLLFTGLKNLELAHPEQLEENAVVLFGIAIGLVGNENFELTVLDLGSLQSPAFATMALEKLESTDLSANVEEALLNMVRDRIKNDEPSRSIVQRLLAGSFVQKYYRSKEYYSALQQVAEGFSSDTEISSQLRQIVLPLMQDPTFSEINSAWAILKPIVQHEDIPQIALLLKSDSEKKQMLALDLLAETGSTPEVQDLLIPYLKEERTSLLAARALSKSGYPGMLDILVEKGMKKLGNYSNLELDVESFRPYGVEAEARLVQLMEYPNRATQITARIFLAKMNSEKALPIIQQSFEQALAKNSLPLEGDIDALFYYGKDPWAPVIDVMSRTGKTVDELDVWDFPSDIARKSIDYFRSALLSTEDEAKAAVLIGLIERFAFPDSDSSEMLRTIQSQHRTAAIRSFIETHLLESDQK